MTRVCTNKLLIYSLFGICVVNVLTMITWSYTGRPNETKDVREQDLVHVQRHSEAIDGRHHRYNTTSGGMASTSAKGKPKPSGYGTNTNSNITAGLLTVKAGWFAEQARRQSTVRQVCQSRQHFGELLSLPQLIKRRSRFLYFIVNDEHRLLYTWIAKVASTNWMSAFLVMKGKYKRVEDVPLKKIGKSSLVKLSSFSKEGIRHRLDNYTNFIFVRHPFVRLLSAYRNKLEENNYYYPKHIGREIIKRYRKNATAGALKSGTGVTFPEFVEYLVNENLTKLDHHWRPVYKLVFPCTVRFDYIGKLESGDVDAHHILKETHIDHLVHFKPTLRNVSDDTARFNHYYSQIPNVDLVRLYRMYKPDFELFGYQIPESMRATLNSS